MMMQSNDSIDSIIAQQFVLTDGGITAYGPDGSLVGVSNPVANESGQLSFFIPDNGTTSSPAEVYCELVSFFLTVCLLVTCLTRSSSTRALMEPCMLSL